jgi:hypothetical protein
VSGAYDFTFDLPGCPLGLDVTVRIKTPLTYNNGWEGDTILSGQFYHDLKGLTYKGNLPVGVSVVVIETTSPAGFPAGLEAEIFRSVMLNDSSQDFTLANVPVTYKVKNLAEYLSTVGSRATVAVPYSFIRPSCLIEGNLRHRLLYPKAFWVHEIQFPCILGQDDIILHPSYTLYMDVEEFARPTYGFINYLPPDLDAEVLNEFLNDPFLAGMSYKSQIIRLDKTDYFYYQRNQDVEVPHSAIDW